MNFALLILTFITLFIILLLARKIKSGKAERAKIRLEDALKHIYNSNKEDTPATLNSIKGHQKISDKSALEIIGNLLKSGLAYRKKNQLFLTEEGKKYALNIIKNHRLWERFLADESGLEEKHWHIEAEKMEHRLTEKERKELRRKLGNPLRDPHGDIIPGEEDDDYDIPGELLSEVTSLGKYKIIHVEDEPSEIYGQLVEYQLFPKTLVEVLSVAEDKITLKTERGIISLEKSLAANLSVVPAEEEFVENTKRLSELKVGEKATVVKLSEKLRGSNRRRLLDLGIIPGSKIEVMYENISGNPRAYNVKNTLIALRNDMADLVLVKEEENA